MSMIIFKHVKASELPKDWMKRLKAKPEETFTVTISPEARPREEKGATEKAKSAFGMWRDREDMGSVEEYTFAPRLVG